MCCPFLLLVYVYIIFIYIGFVPFYYLLLFMLCLSSMRLFMMCVFLVFFLLGGLHLSFDVPFVCLCFFFKCSAIVNCVCVDMFMSVLIRIPCMFLGVS